MVVLSVISDVTPIIYIFFVVANYHLLKTNIREFHHNKQTQSAGLFNIILSCKKM